MPVQRSQGRRRPLVPRSDEIADGVPARSGVPDAVRAAKLALVVREPGGMVRDSASAAVLGHLGGKAKAERDRLLAALPTLLRGFGMRGAVVAGFSDYIADALDFAGAEALRLEREFGGGVLGEGPRSFIDSAALQLAASRWKFAEGDVLTASRLADASRANLMSARDECARDAALRPKDSAATPWLVEGKP